MTQFLVRCAAIALGALAVMVAAQPPIEPPDAAPPPARTPGISAEHTLLSELAGRYDAKLTTWASAGATPVEIAAGVVRQPILGGRFVQEQLDASSATSPFALQMTLGFNLGGREGERFELSRLSSAASPMIIERGRFDASNKVFTFAGEYAIEGIRVKSRTVFRLESNEIQVMDVFVAFTGSDKEHEGVSVPEFKAYSVEYTRRR